MAKKLLDIKRYVEDAGQAFKAYLSTEIPSPILKLLEELNTVSEVYIFSGVIRNFFLKKSGLRDLDIILKREVDIYQFFKDYRITKNSFGGYKIYSNDLVIDLWFLENTWAFKNQPRIPFNIDEHSIPGTAFFNFSAIIYSLRKEQFHAGHKFFQFLQNRKVDLAYVPNANHPLCVVNTLYYEDKFHLKISNRLKKHVIHLYKEKNVEYLSVQRKHFGGILYSDADIRDRLVKYSNSLRNKSSKMLKEQLFL